jgi:hypothetical protein
MKKLFTLVAAAMMLFSASAETLTVYDGTDYLAAVPFNGSWVDEVGNKTQVLFPAEDLTEMVGKTITSMTFYTEPEGCKLDGGLLNISLGETEVSVISDYITEGLTLVGTCSFTAAEDQVVELTINFVTPYVYNGGNLLFENVVVEATDYQFTYWTGVKTNYNCAVVGSYGGASARQFLPKTTFTYTGGDTPEPEVLRGDVNKDGGVNIADVAALIDMLLNNEAMIPEADCDLDGSMNIADAAALVDFLLSGVWE